ncbi:MAG: CRTAC1 family protein [Verrucomicrobiales bacterium]
MKSFPASVAFVPALVALGVCRSAATPDESFVDVTDDAGVCYIQWMPPEGWVKLTPQVMTGGAAVADYDNDGWSDLLVTRYRDTDILFRNRGDGTFEDASQSAGIDQLAPSNGAGWGDIDNDGDADLYISVADEAAGPLRNLLYINGGDGTFSEEAQLRGADLQVPHWHSGFSLCFGDYNRDGWLDIHTCQWAVTGPANRSVLLMNTGHPGRFRDVTAEAGVEMWRNPAGGAGPEFTTQAFTSRLSDIDFDGWPDLVVAGDFGTSRLFWNGRDGTFSDGTAQARIGGEENGMGLAVGDYDLDGLPDLFFTSIYESRRPEVPIVGWGVSGNRLYRNLGGRVFEDTTDIAGVRDGGWGWGTAFFDYDNDGDLDLAMTNGFETDRWETETPFNTDPTRLWRNDGDTFTDVSSSVGISDTGTGKGLLVFDYDKDGDLDLFIVNNAGTPVLYRNDLTNGNHWLRVKARGQYSNRDGVGAVVTIGPGDGAPVQHREITGGSHFLTQSEKVAHFGLGSSAEPVELVSVRWPSGIVQQFSDVAVDQVLEVIEPVSPYEAWLAEHFSEEERTEGSLTAPLADPDADGLNNTVEFGSGLDPRSSENLPPIVALPSAPPGEKIFRYRRRALPRGVSTVIEKSADLESWQVCRDSDLEVLSVEKTTGWGVEIVTARMLAEPGWQTPSRHVRLRVVIDDQVVRSNG